MHSQEESQVPRVAQPLKRIKAIVGSGGIVALFLAVKFLPRILHEQEVREAQREAVRVAAHQVANEAIRERARELASEVVHPSTVVLDRLGYTITLPEGSTVDPEDTDIDKDHVTSANLPYHCTLIVVMIDDKTHGPAAFDRTVASFQDRIQSFTMKSATTFDAGEPVRSVALRGTLKGNEPFVYEVAQWDGPSRAYVVIAEYPESSIADAHAMLMRSLSTLHLKV